MAQSGYNDGISDGAINQDSETKSIGPFPRIFL